MKVAIIDDGISEHSLPHMVAYYRVEDGKVYSDTGNTVTVFSHGSECAKLALRGVKNAEVISLAVYAENQDGKEKDLLAALQWCIDQKIDFINLSNGAISYFDNERINSLCFRLVSCGTVIVAAVSNVGRYTVPAHLPYVIGVFGLRTIKMLYPQSIIRSDIFRTGFAFFRNEKGIHLEAHNSFACAKLTNYMILRREKGYPNLFSSVRNYAKYIYDYSMLKDGYLIGGDDLCPEKFVFPCKRYIGTIKDTEKATIVIADQCVSDKLLESLTKIADKIYLLIWCNGNVPHRIRVWCAKKGIFYSSAPRYNTSRTSFSIDPKLVPINILTVSHGKEGMETAIDLARRFQFNGYHVLVYSTDRYSFLYGAVNSTAPEIILRTAGEYNADLLIVASDDDETKECDMHIQVTTDGYMILEGTSRTKIEGSCAQLYVTVKNRMLNEQENVN